MIFHENTSDISFLFIETKFEDKVIKLLFKALRIFEIVSININN